MQCTLVTTPRIQDDLFPYTCTVSNTVIYFSCENKKRLLKKICILRDDHGNGMTAMWEVCRQCQLDLSDRDQWTLDRIISTWVGQSATAQIPFSRCPQMICSSHDLVSDPGVIIPPSLGTTAAHPRATPPSERPSR